MDWKGKGALPEAQRLKLQAVAARAHSQGRMLVVRSAPEEPVVWETLLVCGVDRIEVGPGDEREARKFARFLDSQPRLPRK